MPPDKVGKFVELPVDLVADVQKMCEQHGTTFTFELVDALRRHVAFPPVRKPEPFVVESDVKPRKKKK